MRTAKCIFLSSMKICSTVEGHAFMTEEQEEHKTPSSLVLEQQLNAEKRRSEEYLTKLRYLQADFENLKKRCDRQLEDAKNYANERIALELVDVVDELELAVKTGKANTLEAKPLLEGVEMTLKKLRKVLEQEGVSPIECEGQVFDPSKQRLYHEEQGHQTQHSQSPSSTLRIIKITKGKSNGEERK
jgi:molecular chaperone GrpE